MSAFADQLKALGLDPSPVPKTPQRTHDKVRANEQTKTPGSLLLQLPRLGTITRVEEDRGFGFIAADGSEDVFFHVRGFPGRLPEGQKLPPVGTPVLFITGSDPRRADKTDKGAVRWAPAGAMPSAVGTPLTNQASLDGLRRQCLDALPWDAFWQVLEAAWYAQRWIGHAPAPTDLEDSVLEQVIGQRLAELTPTELDALQVSGKLASSRYRFAVRLSPGNPACAFTRLLTLFEPNQLAALGAPDATWMQHGVLAEEARGCLLEWHLLSRALWEPRGDWHAYFPGANGYEVDLATRFLNTDIAPDAFTCEWLGRLAGSGLLSTARAEQWAERRPDLALALFEQLPPARQASLLAAWRTDSAELDLQLTQDPSRAISLLTCSALSIDLETDGTRIWEVGCSRNGQASLLHDERSGTRLEPAMGDLGDRIRVAPLLIGHNFLAWDWPIVARYVEAERVPLIWDTLLVQYLLEPQVASHALGGSHHADQDAVAAAQLFEQQLQRMPPSIARGVLAGEFADSAQLLDAIARALEKRVSVAREAPDLLAAAGKPPVRLVITSESRLREVDWVPHATVVAAEPAAGLPASWREIDVSELETRVFAGGEMGPAARVVLAVARLAKAQSIGLRRNMIPGWLIEGDAHLASAVDAACVVPVRGEGLRIAAIPASLDWWTRTDPATYTVVGLSDDVVVLDRRQAARSEFTQDVGSLPAAPFMRIGSGPTPLWLLVDRAAHVLDPRGGLCAFRTLPLGATAVSRDVSRLEMAHRPVLATRRHHVLHPRAADQASYWTEVLRTFLEVAVAGDGRVPILLVGSSNSRDLVDLLATGLAELEFGEVRPAHRSQREHLLRTSGKGYALVDVLDQWPIWQRLAQSAGIVLQPVIEALPIEEWHACAEARLTPRVAGDGSSSSNLPVAAGEAVAIEAAAVLEKLPELAEARLHGWLSDVGLVASQTAVLLIDPRIGAIGKGLTRLADLHHLREAPLLDEQAQRLAIVLSSFQLTREEPLAGFEPMERFLVANWQPPEGRGGNRVTEFKPSQRAAMEAICDRSANILVSLPTGEGKSVLFQVPALCRGLRNRRLTLVLSPLKALMRDQVERLREQGFAESADYLSGDRPAHEIAEVIQGVLDHRIVLLYVAPERMRGQVFLEVLHKRMQADGGLEHVVVDETHCVNQWGYEFRPDYFHALELLLRKCRAMDADAPTPFLLLSATITASDRARLQAILLGASGGPGSPLPLLARPDTFSNPLRTHIAVQPRRVRGQLNDRREAEKALAERIPFIQHAIAQARQIRATTGQRSAVLVFVSSRAHAETVALRLAKEAAGQVDYYHAGLDAVAREEIYTRFLDGDLDVLVATKAFGMGMDIPDIHWVVHLSPPSYLEDYLQEVGRIGRGKREREKAGLEELSAVLLFSDRDFETVRTLRARSALSLPVIKDLHQEVIENAHEVDGQRVAIVPSEGYESARNPPRKSAAASRAAATRVRMAIYWLERAERVVLCGSIPDLITLTIHPPALKRLSSEEGAVAEVARLILQVEESGLSGHAARVSRPSAPHGEQGSMWDRETRSSDSGFLGGLMEAAGKLLGGLADNVGVLIGGPGKSLTTPLRAAPRSLILGPPTPAASSATTVVLNLSQLKLRSGALKSMGDVLAILADLEKRGGVSMNREIQIVPRKLALDPPETIKKFFDYVDGAAAELIRRLSAKGRVEFNPFEMVEDLEGPEVEADRRKLYERALINAFRSLARASGVKLRQLVRDDDKVIWEAVLPRSSCQRADSRRERIRQGAQSLFEVVRGKESVPISTLIERVRSTRPDGRFRESDLNKAVGLLSAMNLVSISPDLVPLSHVVMLSDAQDAIEDRADIWEELKQVNDLAEARNLAMEVFANLDANAHPAFIEGYFATSDAQGLRQFLDTQLGEIPTEGGGEGISPVILEMREKLRATKAVEFFERFRESEEPAQWEVARYPFERHVLVNAGPGAGKTFVLVGRIVHLIREQNIDPSQIVVLAFNRAVVFEIRRRIRALFKSLGYGAYAERLRVSTFHSFAIKNFARIDGVEIDRSDMDGLLARFASRMAADPAFSRNVAGGVRSILVDEFQDVTDHVYEVIRHLHLGSGSRAGVMVIGDDDQDILRWQRKKDRSAHEFSEGYFDRFEHDFGGPNFESFLLGVNFRSGTVIVERSQSMISKLFERSSRSRRLKTSSLVPRLDASEGSCVRLAWEERRWDEAVAQAATILREWDGQVGESTAVLCRSNAEVAEAHRLLSPAMPSLSVQGVANLRVADLRHVGMWLDSLRRAVSENDRALSEDVKREIFDQFGQNASAPEIQSPGTSDIRLDDLWGLCCQEQAFPHLSSLVRFVEELRTDDLGRLCGLGHATSTAVVSTLHKVKGLEFDNVIILPSSLSFGGKAWDSRGSDLAGDAAEEARLLYVGMTRAKRRLSYFVGDRERSWGKAVPAAYAGLSTGGRVLVGSMEDVSLGWAMQKNDFNRSPDECQRYIETEVAIGDPITLGGAGGGAYKAFMHRRTTGKPVQVGFVAKQHVKGGPDASLKVSAVVRFRPDLADDSVADSVRERGWGYVVLVSGRLC